MRRIRIAAGMLPLLLVLLTSCARIPVHPPPQELLAYEPAGDDLLAEHAPIFLITNPKQQYNRIGAPRAAVDPHGEATVFVDIEHPAIYGEIREWQGQQGHYTNLVYRVHFPEIPLSFWPFYLGAGRNVGLLVIVTLDREQQPLLYTLVHTCGCYLAFLPTSRLSKKMLPRDWPPGRQQVYGESLPTMLDTGGLPPISSSKLHILLKDGTHRVVDLWYHKDEASAPAAITLPIALAPLASLNALPLPEGGHISFYETEGSRRDYVRDSGKIWERLFMSWWALDWRVGEDKRLGRHGDDGLVFYTSLKPWARQASDLRDFDRFLQYWGWGL